MRKEFDIQHESFSTFSASLVAGDTAIFTQMSAAGSWLGEIGDLLRRGIVVRTPEQESLDAALSRDPGTIEQLVRLGAAMDRKASMRYGSVAQEGQMTRKKRPSVSLAAKAHRLIEEEGLGVVEACRKVHCRPSDYYIYRGKQKTEKNG